MSRAAEAPSRPDQVTLAAFAVMVLMIGINVNAVKATVEELAPLWSAGLRFAAAGLILTAVVMVRRQPLPRGRALVGSILFGGLSFAGFFAFAYWGIQRLPVGVAAVAFASVPLMTFLAAVLHRVEPFRWQVLAGGALAVGGIAVMEGGPGGGSISILGLLAMLAASACAAEAAIVAKRFPPVPPLMMNAVGMTISAGILVGLSFASGEPHAAPNRAATWLALGYLVSLGSIAVFVIYLFVLRRWTASAVSYEFVLAPIIAVVFAYVFQGERITGGLVIGGLLILAGVYVGALLQIGEPNAKQPTARPEVAGVPADCIRCP